MHSRSHRHHLLAALLFISCSSMAQVGPINKGTVPSAPYPPPLLAAKISGTVVAVTDAEVRLTVSGDQLPNAGDKVDFYFKIPGIDDEVAVGSGSVLSADEKNVIVKFEQGTGKPQAGHLAHIHSAAPRQASATPAIAADAGTQPAPTLDVQQSASPLISWLGLMTDRVPLEMIRALQLRPRGGAQIIGVIPGSPAALAGLQKDDIISEIGGEIVREGDIEPMTTTRQPGTKLAFAVSRNLQVSVKEITLAPPISEEEFSKKIRAAAEAGDPAAQMAYGGALMAGSGYPVNLAEGMTWLTRAAEQNLRKAQCALACIYYEKAGDDEALAQAIEWFRRAAALGDATSQLALAGHYHLKRDLQQAALYARLAAEQGETQAQDLYGTMLLNGEGLPANPAEGVKWIGFAAAAGLPTAQFVLGQAQLRGLGTERDTTAARKNIRSAADQGTVEAMNFLGAMYEKGDGVEKNAATAKEWYQKAAAIPKDAADVGKVATRSPAAGHPPPENKLVDITGKGAMPASPPVASPPQKPAAAIAPVNDTGAFAGTFKGEVTLVSGSNNGAATASGGPCPATFTIRLHPTGTSWGLDISSDRSKPNASQLDGHWNLKANGKTLSSGYSLPAGSEEVSIELLGNEIKGTISSQSKVDGAVMRSSSYSIRATRVQP